MGFAHCCNSKPAPLLSRLGQSAHSALAHLRGRRSRDRRRCSAPPTSHARSTRRCVRTRRDGARARLLRDRSTDLRHSCVELLAQGQYAEPSRLHRHQAHALLDRARARLRTNRHTVKRPLIDFASLNVMMSVGSTTLVLESCARSTTRKKSLSSVV